MNYAEFDIAVADLEVRMERVRSLYQQYFLGFEKIVPSVPHKDVERRMQSLRKVPIKNTARAFKLHTLIQRYNTYQQYWRRTCRDIENGTYRRHVQRAQQQVMQQDLPDVTLEFPRGIALELPDPEEAPPPSVGRAVPPPLPRRRTRGAEDSTTVAAPTPAATPESSALTKERLGQLHGELLEQKRKLNQAPDTSLSKLEEKLRAAEAALRAKHGDRAIDFKVIVKDGKAMVKPVVKATGKPSDG